MAEIKRMRNILMLITSVRVKIHLNLYERCFTLFLNSCEFSSRFGFLLIIKSNILGLVCYEMLQKSQILKPKVSCCIKSQCNNESRMNSYTLCEELWLKKSRLLGLNIITSLSRICSKNMLSLV